MKRIVLLIFTVFLSYSVSSQKTSSIPTITTEYIKKHTSYFTIVDGKIKGEGRNVIKDMINQSQFVTYGELHNSKQTSIFIKALMPFLKKAGFENFAIEVGPTSAKKLAELSTPPSKTIENLKAFNTKYTLSEGNRTVEPIPFFTGISDAEFLQEARSNNMQFWGLDQEFYFATFFLIDELMNTVKDASKVSELTPLKNQANQMMYKHFLDEVQKKNKGAYTLIIKEQAVNDFFDAFPKNNEAAQNIINDMKISWDIYIRWRNDSHADRISYMRNNFMKHYTEAQKKEKLPKVFTKIGSLHASKIISNGAFDIGNLTEELAQRNGTMSTTISSVIPYKKTEKGLVNNLERFKQSYQRYAIMTSLVKKDEWGIINLRQIREDIQRGKIVLPTNGDYHKLKQLILGYDYQIMIPVDEAIIPNRDN